MNLLVTGAPGWLGSRLVEALCGGFNGLEPPFPVSRVRCLVGPGAAPRGIEELGAEPICGDLTGAETLEKAVEGAEVVFHLAGIIHPRWRTTELFAINTGGTRNLLEACVRAGVRRFIHVSSNSAAGANVRRERLMGEEDGCRPYMAYGRSKSLAEKTVGHFHEEGLLQTVIIRPCWYYGPGQPERQTRLFKMVKSGKPVIFGDGENLRSLSYIDNTVHALLLAARSDQADGETYWIADERPYRTIEIYEVIARLLDVKEFKPRFLPRVVPASFAVADRLLQALGLYQMEVHVAGEMHRDIACSVDKARAALGYAPPIALEEGMRRSIEWCRLNGIDI